MTTKNKIVNLQNEIQSTRLTSREIEILKRATKRHSALNKDLANDFDRYMLCDMSAEIICEADCIELPTTVTKLTEWLREFKVVKEPICRFLAHGVAS